MTYVDRYGLPLTTQSRAAVDAYVEEYAVDWKD